MEDSLGDVVVRNPAVAEVFEKFDIDYYCRGGRTLGVALSDIGVPLQTFANEVDRAPTAAGPEWQLASLRSLIHYIVDTHHRYLRVELPALEKWIAGLIEKHSDERELLLTLRSCTQRFQRAMEVQMHKEEIILFPAISAMEASEDCDASSPMLPYGSVANLSHAIEKDNNAAAQALREIRAQTARLQSGPDASAALRTLFERLKTLVAQAHQHLHLENNILFPRAVRLEREREEPCN